MYPFVDFSLISIDETRTKYATIFMSILINKQNNDKFKFKKMFLLQSEIIPLSFLPTGGLFCKDATHINLSKAFDALDHTILLEKLRHYGIRDTELQLINIYISNIYQLTEVNCYKLNR